VIISKYSKSHETSDGSEQQPSYQQSAKARPRGGTAKQNWEDDGGPSNDHAPHAESEVGKKPAWSVLSLRDLNDAIQQSRRADDPWRLHQEAQRLQDRRTSAARTVEANAAAATRGERNFYRNPWEHT
jgi:hypothetical protein